MNKYWQTAKRKIAWNERALVMAILNVTPDSFSDGGKFTTTDVALRQAEVFVNEGADFIDVGGESTRPGGEKVSAEIEIARVCPIIEAVSERFDIPISIDTSKSDVAENAIESGAEIVNDISGLKFDENVAKVAADKNAGLVLMHLRGDFETMHKQQPVEDVLANVSAGLNESVTKARKVGVSEDQICLDVGIGFSKTFEQNLELISKLDKLRETFSKLPLIVGASRKSFIGKILDERSPVKRLNGTMGANSIAVWNGANILRVHDVKATVEAVKVVEAIKEEL